MMNNPLISVVVPVYKVEEYLDECLESLVCQTYPNIEIILVDDGSPDGCPQICDTWSEKDARIRVCHKQNGGLSSARNAGIEIATGDYISFVDSDDFFDKQMYEKLYDGICRSPNIGISAIQFYRYTEGKVDIYNKKWHIEEDMIISSQEFGIVMLRQDICYAATNKLYRRDLLKSVRFREGKINEDVLFMHDIAKEIEDRGYDMWNLSYYAYYYRMRPNSICHSEIPVMIPYIENLHTIVTEAVSKEYKSTALKVYHLAIYDFCYHLLKNKYSEKGKYLYDKFFPQYQKLISISYYADVKDVHHNPIKAIISLVMMKNFPKIYSGLITYRNGSNQNS